MAFIKRKRSERSRAGSEASGTSSRKRRRSRALIRQTSSIASIHPVVEDSPLCPCFERCWCCIQCYRHQRWLRLGCAVGATLLIIAGIGRTLFNFYQAARWSPSTLPLAQGALDFTIDPFFSTLGLYLVVKMTMVPSFRQTEEEVVVRPIFFGAAADKILLEVIPGVIFLVSTLKMNKTLNTFFVFVMGASVFVSVLEGLIAGALSFPALRNPLNVCRKGGGGCGGYVLAQLSILISSIVISSCRVHIFMCGYGLHNKFVKDNSVSATQVLPPVPSQINTADRRDGFGTTEGSDAVIVALPSQQSSETG